MKRSASTSPKASTSMRNPRTIKSLSLIAVIRLPPECIPTDGCSSSCRDRLSYRHLPAGTRTEHPKRFRLVFLRDSVDFIPLRAYLIQHAHIFNANIIPFFAHYSPVTELWIARGKSAPFSNRLRGSAYCLGICDANCLSDRTAQFSDCAALLKPHQRPCAGKLGGEIDLTAAIDIPFAA